ncbi:hypothetical protein ZWY2020_057819 [Hordeum vulgare]|nr:hypothetical protein ZWY2020_057819 [Hordeum vulgare]
MAALASNVLVSGLNGLGAETGIKWICGTYLAISSYPRMILKNRAAACVEKLQELNNAVLISALTEELTTEHLSKFQSVVFTNLSLDKAVEFNDYCRATSPIPFIKTEVCGLLVACFVTLGLSLLFLINGFLRDDERFEFQDGDLVVFTEVSGMTELNDGKPRKIVDARPFSFCIEEDTRNFGIYAKGGIVTQVKEPMILEFKRCSKFVEFTASINEAAIDYKMDELDEKLLQHFASGSRAVLNPMAAMFGGIVGQEVVKACSGKFHPQYQFFYFDSLESLPTYALDPKDLKPVNSRYDAQISVFGSKLQKKMRDSNIFVAKSTVAATAASAINSSFHIDALQNRACPETEHVFNDAFWEGLDAVINALDNANARMYMDMRCLYFQKPLLESGTLGPKCNIQMKQAPMCTVHSFPHNIDHCLTWARFRITSNRWKQLTFTFPEDAGTSTGAPFWSAPLIYAAVIEDLLTKLEACAKKLPSGFQMKPIQFEKDDDTNFHMDLIAGLANMRARNYGIQEVDKLKAKFIAGRIIPAIATTTAMATGLVCLELYKVLAGDHPVEDYCNTFANLALLMFSMAEPVPPKEMKHQDMRWTVWDRWSIKGNITVVRTPEVVGFIKGLTAYSASCGTSLLHNTMFPRHKDRLKRKMVDVAQRKHFDVVVAYEDDDGNDIDIPLISIYS